MRAQQAKEEKLNIELQEMEMRNSELGYERQELEIENQKLQEHIDSILQYMHQISHSFKSEYLQEVFKDIVAHV